MSQARDDGGLAWRNESGVRWTGQVVESTNPGCVCGGVCQGRDESLAWATSEEKSLAIVS